MREIKFRAWDKVNKRRGMVSSVWWNSALNIKNVQYYFQITERGIDDVDSAVAPVEDLELMQFTGLLDRQGKEIYEGDIVKTFEEIGRVIYKAPSFMLAGVEQQVFDTVDDYFINSEVIGNIYENPELLIGAK